ncbi:hypothetical protein [Pontibacillus yanchengensis]|nr:hypothetical protein [Pontibacillus yanchengensis]
MGILSKLSKLSKYKNDVSAISKGRTGQRVKRRATGKVTGKIMRRLFR